MYNNDLSLDDSFQLQIRLKNDIDIFKEPTKPKESVKKEKKTLTFRNAIVLLNVRQQVLNAFKSEVFPKKKKKKKQGKGLKCILDCVVSSRIACVAKASDGKQLIILTPKKMLQRLPIALA